MVLKNINRSRIKANVFCAFTIVELIIVITVIGVLTTIGFVSYNKILISTRDNQSSSKINVLYQALEKYYLENGEYPSCDSMTQSSSLVTSNTLKNLGEDAFSSPYSPDSSVNSIVCANPTSRQEIGYVGNSGNNSLTNSKYTLKYIKAENNTVISVGSRHGQGTFLVAAPEPEIPETTFSVTINESGNVDSSHVKCNAGSPKYHFRYRINDSSDWVEPGSWTPDPSDPSFDLTTAQGKKYGLIMQARCEDLATEEVLSPVASTPENTYVSPISSIPTTPTESVSTVGSNTTWSWTSLIASCPADTTAGYQYDYTISPAGYDSGWIDNGSNLSISFDTSTAGQTYTVAVRARCSSTYDNGSWSASSTKQYVRTSWLQITTGMNGACGILSDNNAYCWGNNLSGNLGNNSTTSSLVPVPVYRTGLLNGLTVKSIVSGNAHSCVVASDDNAYCWGYGGNSSGRLGNNTQGVNSLVPVAVYRTGVLSGLTVKSMSAGSDHTCAIASDDNAYCWGSNNYGQIGNSPSSATLVPAAVYRAGVLNGLSIKAITSRDYFNCVIASDDNAYCWGFNYKGQLGNNSTTYSTVPVAVDKSGALNGLTIKAISAGLYHTCAIASDNNAYCWGYNNRGQLGINSTTDSLVPVAVDRSGALNGLTIKSISAGMNYSTCAIASDNYAYCWGYNSSGQLGNNSTTNSSVPVAVDRSGVLSGLTMKSISMSSSHACAIASDNNTYCWGYNGSNGILGNNSTTNSLVPVKVVNP